MSEDAVYIDSGFIAIAGFELINAHRNREYKFLSNLADFIDANNGHLKRGQIYYAKTFLSKKKLSKVLEDARIPYKSLHTKWHYFQRTAFVTF